jgi:hypothetical protein
MGKLNRKHMERSVKTYWVLSAALSAIMFFSAFYTGAQVEGFRRLGLPDYLRIEIVVAKIIGALLLLFSLTPQRVKEWIYAGFGICLISASVAKLNSGFTVWQVFLDPGIATVVVVVLIWRLYKLNEITTSC